MIEGGAASFREAASGAGASSPTVPISAVVAFAPRPLWEGAGPPLLAGGATCFAFSLEALGTTVAAFFEVPVAPPFASTSVTAPTAFVALLATVVAGLDGGETGV